MSKIRDELEYYIDFCDDRGGDTSRHAKMALILLDAMHKVESRNYGEGADWEICKKAIAKAEQV